MRGNPSDHIPPFCCNRSIPACAGEPISLSFRASGCMVYPRVCGGTEEQPREETRKWGLSPRVRGNHWHGYCLGRVERSIPACAGEPPEQVMQPCPLTVYPRVCGGTFSSPLQPPVRRGLSPRVRGNPPPRIETPPRIGSIPACAGEPQEILHRPCRLSVYPRVCGGTLWEPYSLPYIQGLSPRVRGNLILPPDTSREARSIPACAGEPIVPQTVPNLTMVYPRVCGGTDKRGDCPVYSSGLSPRVRGNLFILAFQV